MEQKNKGKIVVLAGNREQFKHWLRHNIIPITNRHDVERLRGVRIREVYKEGSWHEWMDAEIDEIIRMSMVNKCTCEKCTGERCV